MIMEGQWQWSHWRDVLTGRTTVIMTRGATRGDNNEDCDHDDKKKASTSTIRLCLWKRWWFQWGRTAATLSWTAAVTAKHYSSVMRTVGSNAQCLTSPRGEGSGSAGKNPLTGTKICSDFMYRHIGSASTMHVQRGCVRGCKRMYVLNECTTY